MPDAIVGASTRSGSRMSRGRTARFDDLDPDDLLRAAVAAGLTEIAAPDREEPA